MRITLKWTRDEYHRLWQSYYKGWVITQLRSGKLRITHENKLKDLETFYLDYIIQWINIQED